jgi:hypothetical protein
LLLSRRPLVEGLRILERLARSLWLGTLEVEALALILGTIIVLLGRGISVVGLPLLLVRRVGGVLLLLSSTAGMMSSCFSIAKSGGSSALSEMAVLVPLAITT